MAEKLDSASGYVWTTVKPFIDSPRRSSYFWFLTYQLFLSFTRTFIRADHYVYSLMLHKWDLKPISGTLGYITAFLAINNKCISARSASIREARTNVIQLNDFGSEYNNSPHGQWTVYFILSENLPTELHDHGNERMQLSNVPDSKIQQSSIMMKAKLAACSPDDPVSDLENLSFEFSKLLEDKSTADVTLRCGDRTFYAHRLILGARSEVFAAMFRNRMVESEKGRINITDIDGEVLGLLLKYVYSGKIPDLSDSIAFSLYKAADKYSIHNLKNKCSKWMLESLSNENCLDLLFLADAYGDERFKDRLVNFVADIISLLKEEAWVKFSKEHPKLTFTVLQRLALKNKRD